MKTTIARQRPLKGGRKRANCYLHPDLLVVLKALAKEVKKSVSYTLASMLAEYTDFNEAVLEFRPRRRRAS